VRVLLALAAGYVLGARTAGKDLDRLAASMKALMDTDEFAEVVSAARSQVGNHLRVVADLIGGEGQAALPAEDIVERVTRLVRSRRVL
jgi:hypothetical protein